MGFVYVNIGFIASVLSRNTYSLKRTVEPGVIPSLMSTIGGPKQRDLIAVRIATKYQSV